MKRDFHGLRFERLEPRTVLASVGWDGSGKGSAELTYYIGDIPSTIDEEAFREGIKTALSAWSNVVDVDFQESSAARQRNSIDISFRALDGAGGTLAEAYLPSDVNPGRIAGDIRFDSEETWEFGNARRAAATDLIMVAVHEIGHALGLEHSDDPNSIMYPSISPNQSFKALPDVDIESILELYAPREKVVLRGDLDNNGTLSETDIDLLDRVIRAHGNDSLFDLNSDGRVDQTDRHVLVEELLNTSYGDSNLDNRFDTDDLVLVFQAGRFGTTTDKNSTWSTGDWDGDGLFNTSDLVLAFQRGRFTIA